MYLSNLIYYITTQRPLKDQVYAKDINDSTVRRMVTDWDCN